MGLPKYVKVALNLAKSYKHLGQPFSASVRKCQYGYGLLVNDDVMIYIDYSHDGYSLGYNLYRHQYPFLNYDAFMWRLKEELDLILISYQGDSSKVNQFKDELMSKGFKNDLTIGFKYRYGNFIVVNVDSIHNDYYIKVNRDFVYVSKEFNYDDMQGVLTKVMMVVDAIKQLDEAHTKIKDKLLVDLTNSIRLI